MNQTNEAAQGAVRRRFAQWFEANKHEFTSDYCKYGPIEAAYLAWSAALKAQPVPTEAANFCARCGKRLHAGSIHTCTPPATEAAQGEDSARLEWISVEDRLPNEIESQGDFLIFGTRLSETPEQAYYDEGFWAIRDADRICSGDKPDTPTHWMIMPAGPQPQETL